MKRRWWPGRERGDMAAKVGELDPPPPGPVKIRPAPRPPRVMTRQGRGCVDVIVNGHRVGAVKAFGRRYRPGEKITVKWWGLCNLCAKTMPLGRKDAHGAVDLLVQHWQGAHEDNMANGGAA